MQDGKGLVEVPILDETAYPRPTETAATEAIHLTKGSISGLVLDHNHLGAPPPEVCEDPKLLADLESVDPRDAFEQLLAKTELFTNEVFLYAIEYDGNQSFFDVDELKGPIESICSYAEDFPELQLKLKFVAKECLEKQAVAALPYLANHGRVCNLQKEIGIRAVYACLASASTVDEASDISSRIRRLLITFREVQLERMYVAQDEMSWRGDDRGIGRVDSHDMTNYRNAFSDYIGLPRIPDHDIQEDFSLGTVSIFFRRFYTVETISQYVLSCANDAPKRLDYHALVACLRYNRPSKWSAEDAEEFLFHCFDDKGQFTLGSIVWILFKIGIFKPERSESEIDVNALFPPLDEIRLSVSRENLLARSREPVAHAQVEDELRASLEHIPLSKSHEHKK